MAKAYQMQIQRVVEGGCGRQLINVGEPIIVEADNKREAKCKAASQKLAKHPGETGSLHLFLVKQVNRRKCFLNQHIPFQWFILVGETSWT